MECSATTSSFHKIKYKVIENIFPENRKTSFCVINWMFHGDHFNVRASSKVNPFYENCFSTLAMAIYKLLPNVGRPGHLTLFLSITLFIIQKRKRKFWALKSIRNKHAPLPFIAEPSNMNALFSTSKLFVYNLWTKPQFFFFFFFFSTFLLCFQ